MFDRLLRMTILVLCAILAFIILYIISDMIPVVRDALDLIVTALLSSKALNTLTRILLWMSYMALCLLLPASVVAGFPKPWETIVLVISMFLVSLFSLLGVVLGLSAMPEASYFDAICLLMWFVPLTVAAIETTRHEQEDVTSCTATSLI